MIATDNLAKLEILIQDYEETAMALAETDPLDDSFWPQNYKLRLLEENIGILYELETRRMDQWSADREAFMSSAYRTGSDTDLGDVAIANEIGATR